jgi:hypothetical protein
MRDDLVGFFRVAVALDVLGIRSSVFALGCNSLQARRFRHPVTTKRELPLRCEANDPHFQHCFHLPF